ncbi:MAG: hypothetical protein RTU92_11080 [Candidatus Thorarchaeota archaeon]
MTKSLLSDELVGAFFGVGSVGEKNPTTPLSYVKKLTIPYVYQVTDLPEEDMVRQFAYLIEGFEDEGDFIVDVDLYTFREITEEDIPLIPDIDHSHSLYHLVDGTQYQYLKTQQTAPISMCFTTRGSDGKQHLTQSMFHLFTSLMSRIAVGQVEHLSSHCDSIIFCQDDPALGLVIEMLNQKKIPGLSLSRIMQATESVYPPNVIPAFHYCDDWRNLDIVGQHILWDGPPKLAHIDVVSYNPAIDSEQAEKLNSFLERGGGLALGVLPNVDAAYTEPARETLVERLHSTLGEFIKSGVSPDLLEQTSMISTQCGLSRASAKLTREIHESSSEFPTIFEDIMREFR